ncbi:hypothetical protein CoNPh26_CDS0128 [Staphylococcus phage S-CoN_Ph26]|nr:hypothetical protein CoNPh26_CDS0128 [Staphylococcus phage S-CoN_Ph26]
MANLKKGTIDKVKDWLEEAGGGDGGYIKYLDNITTPYSQWSTSWICIQVVHPGIDLPYHYEPVYSTISGTAHTKRRNARWFWTLQNMVGWIQTCLKYLWSFK